MNLSERFQDHWQKQFCHLTTNNCHLLLAVSGGVDSVVLVDLLNKAGFTFRIAHCNFQLRGEESERDEQFVRNLAAKYGKEVLVKRFETKEYAAEKKCSIQEAARYLRYAWFEDIINAPHPVSNIQYPASSIQHPVSSIYTTTAHHADDNIETLLMHFFRGTGIQGLTGIQPILKERKLIRPLLSFRKSELLEYAQANGLGFVEDSSNASDKYTRNYFRNQLIPQIKEVYPQVEENLLHNIQRFSEVAELYEQSVRIQLNKLIEAKGNEYHIPVLKWKKAVPLHTLTWELIKPYGFTAAQTNEVVKLLDAENGSHIASSTHRIIRNRNWMIISPNATESAQHIIIESGETKVSFENGVLQLDVIIHNSTFKIQNNSSEAFVDLKNIQFPLLLRKWKTGDYFYPLGMQKKKKISRFLIDLKLSKPEKEKVWVLESNQKIIWVVGYRIDDRFKITDQTKNILQANYLK
jgi:tRNA(Ile)-lysidine synthase